MKQVCILIVSACFWWHADAQFSLRGTVQGANNETLIGAHVSLNNSYSQKVTDNSGNYSFSVRPGNYLLKVSYVGYENYSENITLRRDTVLNILLHETTVVSDAVIVSAVRATENTPTTFTTISKDEISRNNLAQDLPYMLGNETSVVATSDAGAGVGYTGLRIRGSDITRINVTINGIPLNDPESHAVYWVDVPDFASSVNSLQLQRGVGSSTNGAGAFGASMNLETNTFQKKPFGLVNLGYGSFNTRKASVQAGTGLIRDHWYLECRGSAISSDGYIDRATSDLKSFFIQGGYSDDKTLVKAVVFGGKEITYQAWYGVDAFTLKNDRRFNWAGAIFNPDGTISYYKNQTDNYIQNHYQLHVSRRLTHSLSLNLSGHYTAGKGYYEEYIQDAAFSAYGLNNIYFGKDSVFNGTAYDYFYHDTIRSTDLVRRRWLDNRYYGITWSVHYTQKKTDLILGGAVNKYDKAKHYGEIIWAEFAGQSPDGYRYYLNTSFKTEFNIFAKAAWTPVESLTLYGDMQYRTITYKDHGIESDLNPVAIHESFDFFNPKIGVAFNRKFGTLYASYAIAHREPIRDDYLDAVAGEKPRPEMLGDLEAGLRKTDARYRYSVNYYLMNYRDQLVLTGAINNDGQYIRKNAGKSFRSGFEFSGALKPVPLVEVEGNISLSMNKTDFKQLNAKDSMINFKNTILSFSPSVVGGAQVRFFPADNLEIAWLLKYVGKQYLDNTESNSLSLNPYTINNVRIGYLVSGRARPDLELTLMINNIFNRKYESNGSVYGDTPYYYPQAGINFLAGLSLKF